MKAFRSLALRAQMSIPSMGPNPVCRSAELHQKSSCRPGNRRPDLYGDPVGHFGGGTTGQNPREVSCLAVDSPSLPKPNKDSVPVVGGSFLNRAGTIKCKSRSVRRLEKQHRGCVHYAFRNTGIHTLQMNAEPQKQIPTN